MLASLHGSGMIAAATCPRCLRSFVVTARNAAEQLRAILCDPMHGTDVECEIPVGDA